MTRANVDKIRLSIAALALGTSASACIATVEGVPEDDIAVVEQELGGYTELLNAGNESPMDIGPTYTIFRLQPTEDSCGFADVVFTQTGARAPVPPLPGCANITTARSQSIVLVADQRGGKIYRLLDNPTYQWVAVASTGGVTVSGIVNDDTRLWWYGAQRLHRVSLATGLEEQGPISYCSGELLGIDVARDVLYMDCFFEGTYDLTAFWLKGNGNYAVNDDASATSFAPWSSSDADYFYWVEPGSPQGTHRIRRLSKDTGSPSTVKSGTGIRYYAPLSNGSALYWLETTVSTGTTRLRRMNLANGNHTSTTFPFAWFDPPSLNRMRLLPNGTLEPVPHVALARRSEHDEITRGQQDWNGRRVSRVT